MIRQLSLQIFVVGTASQMLVSKQTPLLSREAFCLAQLGGGLMKRLLHALNFASIGKEVKP